MSLYIINQFAADVNKERNEKNYADGQIYDQKTPNFDQLLYLSLTSRFFICKINNTILSALAEFTVMAHIILRLYMVRLINVQYNIVMKGNACLVFTGKCDNVR